ncbi:MAG: hypothetical protein Q8P59_04170, partial [Dehalococcoidia bacterium]|nr:hypothetical protein [Dehalococcoidia bacterium]
MMAQDRTASILVQALKLRRLSVAILREAEALEASVAPVAAWDDPAITRTDLGEGGKAYETSNSAVNPKGEDELLDLIE